MRKRLIGIAGMAALVLSVAGCGAGADASGSLDQESVESTQKETLLGKITEAVSGGGSASILEEDAKTGAFSSIQVGLGALDLNIIPSEDNDTHVKYHIRVKKSYKAKGKPVQYNVEDGVLKLTEKIKSSKIQWRGWSSYVEIRVPDGTKLSGADIQTDAGDVTVESIPLENVTMVQDAGDCLFQDITLKDASITIDAGDVELERVTLEEVSIDLDAGDLEGDSVKAAGNVSVTADAGDIELEKTAKNLANLNVEIRTDVGDVELSKAIRGDFQKIKGGFYRKEAADAAETLSLKTDAGDISIS